MVGVAVKVTLVPAQIVVADAPILTLTGNNGLTVIVMILLVTVTGTGQVALEVISTFTWLPFASVLVV